MNLITNNERSWSKDALFKKLSDERIDNVIFVGNPGAGKSTLINCICGEAVFKAGVAFYGITEVLQQSQIRGVNFIDTPGLDDMKAREKAGKEIETALKTKGVTKLLFVMTLEAGRIKPTDLATIGVVLRSIDGKFKDSVKYGVIVNKVTEQVLEADIRDELILCLGQTLDPPPSSVSFVMEDPVLIGQNKFTEPSRFLIDAINNTPGIKIYKNINQIVYYEIEKLREEQEKALNDAKKMIEELKAQLKQLSKPRFRVGKGKKLHSVQCSFYINSEGRKVRVIDYNPIELCLICSNFE